MLKNDSYCQTIVGYPKNVSNLMSIASKFSKQQDVTTFSICVQSWLRIFTRKKKHCSYFTTKYMYLPTRRIYWSKSKMKEIIRNQSDITPEAFLILTVPILWSYL